MVRCSSQTFSCLPAAPPQPKALGGTAADLRLSGGCHDDPGHAARRGGRGCPCGFGSRPCSARRHQVRVLLFGPIDSGILLCWRLCSSRLPFAVVSYVPAVAPCISNIRIPDGDFLNSFVKFLVSACNMKQAHTSSSSDRSFSPKNHSYPNPSRSLSGAVHTQGCCEPKQPICWPPPRVVARIPFYFLHDRAKVARAMDPNCELPEPHPSVKV